MCLRETNPPRLNGTTERSLIVEQGELYRLLVDEAIDDVDLFTFEIQEPRNPTSTGNSKSRTAGPPTE